MVKNKSISLLWEINSIFMKILRKKSIVWTTNMAALSRGSKLRISMVDNDKVYNSFFCF